MRSLPLFSIVLALASCKKQDAAPPAMPPPAVSYLPAAQETVEITREMPGRIDAIRVAEVRARVPGILLEKTFEEGAEVDAGAILFRIDPASFEATRDSAAGNLARAEAVLEQAKRDAERFRSLVSSNAVSQREADNALSAAKIAEAEVATAAAALKTAELNLSYATVTAPISGRIGRAQVTEGALVGQGAATLLAVIQQLNPIYLDFTQSSADLLNLKRAAKAGTVSEVSNGSAAVTLLLENGEEYPHPGKILFSEASVDPSTSMVSLRAEFPNPDRLLLPGMFARVRVVQAIRENAVTVLQRAVTHTRDGSGSVLVIDDENTAQVRMIQTAEAHDGKWIVTSGLKAGERVIIEGHMKARPGTPVNPELFAQDSAASATSEPSDDSNPSSEASEDSENSEAR